MPVKGTEYHDGMNPEGRFQLYISGKNIDSGSMESTQISFVLKKPQLVIQVQTHITISYCDRQGFFPEHIAAGNIFFVPARYGKYFLVPLGSSNHWSERGNGGHHCVQEHDTARAHPGWNSRGGLGSPSSTNHRDKVKVTSCKNVSTHSGWSKQTGLPNQARFI